jgi:catechol 2,3-dioxygenase-like lactoylglutathione lyase family enzyme
MLGDQKLMAFVGVWNADKARAFYRDTLGLKMLYEDAFGLVFDVGGIMLRVKLLNEVGPQSRPVLGWQVSDATATARALAGAGVIAIRYPGTQQDDDGIWTAPEGARIAWFKDSDRNILGITQM